MEAKWTEATFDTEVLKSDLPVMVDFYADWCGPCKMLAPTVEQLAEDYAGKAKIGKVNVDDNMKLASEYGIMSIPAILYFKNGRVVDQIVGAVPRKQLEQKLTALL